MAGRITQEELRILNQAQEGKNSYPGLEEQQPYAFGYFFNKQILHCLSFLKRKIQWSYNISPLVSQIIIFALPRKVKLLPKFTFEVTFISIEHCEPVMLSLLRLLKNIQKHTDSLTQTRNAR